MVVQSLKQVSDKYTYLRYISAEIILVFFFSIRKRVLRRGSAEQPVGALCQRKTVACTWRAVLLIGVNVPDNSVMQLSGVHVPSVCFLSSRVGSEGTVMR